MSDSGHASNEKVSKIRFTKEQDELILELLTYSPRLTWREIAERIPGKTGKQCRERYQNFLNPNIARSPWTASEDLRLSHWQQFIGNDWSALAKCFPGRTNHDVKNRYNGHIRGERSKQLDIFLSVMNT